MREPKKWREVHGRGPSPLELSESSSGRQIGSAHCFIDEEK